ETSEYRYRMSIMSSSPLESSLTSSWDSSNPYPDIHTVMFGYSGRLLPYESQPQFWSKYQVWDWVQQIMDMHQIDTSSIPLQNFDMDGHQLCSLSYQDFLLAAGSVGPILFNSLSELKWSGNPGSVKSLFVVTEMCEPCLHPVLPVASHTPSNQRGIHLWEFIRDILIDPERNPGLIKWEDRREGVFRFLKSEAVAQLWGKKKNNSSMTYEKLSRAMRYYYKREILERVDGRRLVYKFGRNARGWREVEK
uniref:ETS homologous factor n=1 Tax=Periophthalmus magnuspinnatus TaxID=409849 RepID=A0A3B4B879_9GOBI